MTIEKNSGGIGYKLTYKRHNGSSVLVGSSRIGLINSMIEIIFQEKEEAKNEQDANDLQDHKLGMI